MLELKNVIKNYGSGENQVQALKGVNITFRNNEFVSILGQSGCGKTTLLNIVGGLDKYTSGDLIIDGISTKKYQDKDWDTYRNHSVGFVFQSYHLIPHQSVLQNVEVALSISGVKKGERRQRAIKALKAVGLGNQLHKRPAEMSGGQMQRVAIARALVNNPEIILADEPTGALDSETSIQVMEILKEVAKEKLVVMVTHNPELAEKYSTRIVRMLDGRIINDSNPVKEAELQIQTQEDQQKVALKKTRKKPSMSFWTAFRLSLHNLFTKKGRTFLTAFAGSIGIIGIALILAVSSGMTAYINTVQRDTLSKYPISLTATTTDYTSLLSSFNDGKEDTQQFGDDGVYQKSMVNNLDKMLASMQGRKNNLGEFKTYLDEQMVDESSALSTAISGISYDYNLRLFTYTVADGVYEKRDVDNLVKTALREQSISNGGATSPATTAMIANMDMVGSIWEQILVGKNGELVNDLVKEQYLKVYGNWPSSANQVILILDENNAVDATTLYALGLISKEDVLSKEPASKMEYADICGHKVKVILGGEIYEDEPVNGKFEMKTDLSQTYQQALELEIVGIVKPNPEAAVQMLSGSIGYTKAFTELVAERTKNLPVVLAQQANLNLDVTTGMAFSSLNPLASAENNLVNFNYVDLDNPSKINLYANSFENKEQIETAIKTYNAMVDEASQIKYTDYVALMMSGITAIINAISYVLIAFVAISLIVSSIMVGVITLISVQERTKEIGVLRAIGASKKDVSRMFTAETLIIGFTSGMLGVLTTYLLCLPINNILHRLTGLKTLSAILQPGAAITLVVISMILTLISGIIPSRSAAKKDPVVALRTE